MMCITSLAIIWISHANQVVSNRRLQQHWRWVLGWKRQKSWRKSEEMRHHQQREMRKHSEHRCLRSCLSYDSELESFPTSDRFDDSDNSEPSADSIGTENFKNPNHRLRWENGDYVGSDFLDALKKCADNGESGDSMGGHSPQRCKKWLVCSDQIPQGLRDMPDEVIHHMREVRQRWLNERNHALVCLRESEMFSGINLSNCSVLKWKGMSLKVLNFDSTYGRKALDGEGDI